jgi:hypothetical protein
MRLGRKLAVGEIVEDAGYEELPAPEPTAEVVVCDEEERVEALVRR